MTSETQTNAQPVAKVIYILLIVSTIIGITGVIALIMAYVNRDIQQTGYKRITDFRFVPAG